MTTFQTVIGFVAFFAIALVGWAVAELKDKACAYVNNEQEDAVEKAAAEQLHRNGFSEMSIHDVKKNISTKGFSAK